MERPSIELRDPRALRALAHPTRLVLLGLLRREGPMTATQAGARLDELPAACSFHLRQLARWGLVEEAGWGRGRERPWRATARSTSWTVTSDEDAEAGAALSSVIVERQLSDLLAWFERMPDAPQPWRESHQYGDTLLTLTPAEAVELGERVQALFAEYQRPNASPDAAPVVVLFAAYPTEQS
jgi:DNA-binding transcriptional ArsR family regulator